jgi:carbon monoxide dehydrogenase subunit G
MARMDQGGARHPYEMAYSGTFELPVGPDAVWADIGRFDRYGRWWRWLRDLEVEGDDVVAGTLLRGEIVPPVPYRMRVEVLLVECAAPERIDARVAGDLEGPARLRIQPTQAGSAVSIDWRLEMTKPAMRAAARLAYPLLRWGHDRVVSWTVAGYLRHLDRRGGRGSAR